MERTERQEGEVRTLSEAKGEDWRTQERTDERTGERIRRGTKGQERRMRRCRIGWDRIG